MESKTQQKYNFIILIDLVKNDVQKTANTNIPTHNNLTAAEKGALQELKERDGIVIKSADKVAQLLLWTR